MASFMFLVTSCDSLSTMVKQCGLTQCPGVMAMMVYRGWGPEVFFEPVPEEPKHPGKVGLLLGLFPLQ